MSFDEVADTSVVTVSNKEVKFYLLTTDKKSNTNSETPQCLFTEKRHSICQLTVV